ncbi:MAG: hypothetical protein Q6373_009595 [Candidatus Sigynarchaeota archaeon]
MNLASLSPPASPARLFGHRLPTPSLPFRAWRSGAPVRTADKAPIDTGLGPRLFPPRSFANDRWGYQEGFTVYFSRTLLCRSSPARFRGQGAGTTRLASAREPPGSHGTRGSPNALSTLPATGFSLVAAVTREKAVHRHARRKRPDASRRRNHVARTWRGGRRIFPFGKVRATAAGAFGMRPARGLHADARISFLIYTRTPVYLKHAIKGLTWRKDPLQFFVA